MRAEPSTEPGHHDVTFAWHDGDPDAPAHAVLLRLVSHTDSAFDTGDLNPYLMRPTGRNRWELTLRLPSALRSSYQLCPVRDEPWSGHPSPQRWADICRTGIPDPLNPTTLAAGVTYGNAGPASILELPDALPQPWHARRAGTPAGSTQRHEVTSPDGTAAAVDLYQPPGYRSGTTYPLAILFDAGMWATVDIAATFDNLIADARIRPMIVAGIDWGRGPVRWRNLTSPRVFEPYILATLLPWLYDRYSVSTKPAETVLIGQSLGGIAAAQLAHTHPDRFGWVVGQSPALWWPGDADGGLSGRDVINSHAGSRSGTGPRYFIEAGTTEGELLATVRSYHSVLDDAGRAVLYREYEGGHDVACWRGGVADGLIAAFGTG